MGKIKIYLKLVDGVLQFRDSEQHHGQSIKTAVNPGDSIVWKLDQCSGITDITGINPSAETFFSEKPEKKDFDHWKAVISKKAKGDIYYMPTVTNCTCECKDSVVAEKAVSALKGNEPPQLSIEI